MSRHRPGDGGADASTDGAAALTDSTVAVVGLGLVGASLGLALRGAVRRRLGIPGPETSADARAELLAGGVVDEIVDLERLEEADVVVLATPVRTVLALVPQVASHMRRDALLTDVASSKRAVVAALARATREYGVQTVGGHPMRGGVQSGHAAATADLFAEGAWVLCPVTGSDAEALECGRALAAAVGAHAVEVDAGEHDAAAAAGSHLPFLAAHALVATRAATPSGELLSARGFARAAGGAAADVDMWADVLATNADAVAAALDHHIAELAGLRAAVLAARRSVAPGSASDALDDLRARLAAGRDALLAGPGG